VRLSPVADVLMVGEGIETCFAAMQATGRPAWAALSTSGLRALDLPAEVREVILLADGDDPGEVAARDAALEARVAPSAGRPPPAGFRFQ
jgi:putative DNA primase/helicase